MSSTTASAAREDADEGAREGEDATAPTARADDEKGTRDGDEEGEEEEEECGFCKYMKGGSCKEAFIAWEACVDAAKERGEDFVDVCFETTSALRDCMLLDPEYYGPMVGDEEKAAKEEDEATEVAEAKTA